MKKRFCATAIAASMLSLCAFSYQANASIIEIGDNTIAFPSTSINPLVPSTGLWTNTESGSSSGYALSPWQDSSTPGATYSVLDAGGGGMSTATYVQSAGTTTFSVLWGSADSYNSIELFDQLGNKYTFTGSLFGDCCQSGVPTHDWVTFGVSGLSTSITEVILGDNGQAAFEYSNPTVGGSFDTTTPLPGALPLFGGGLALMGLFGWRRKRNGPAGLAA